MPVFSKLFVSVRTSFKKNQLICEVPYSLNTLCFAKILRHYNFIYGFVIVSQKQQIRMFLRYSLGRPAISSLKRVSKAGARKYVQAKTILRLSARDPATVFLVSSSSGLRGYPRVVKNTTRSENFGEFICKIW